MKKEAYTDEQLWDEVLEVLHDNRRELTDEEVEALLHERKTFPLRYLLPPAAALLAVGLFLWGPSEVEDSPKPMVAEAALQGPQDVHLQPVIPARPTMRQAVNEEPAAASLEAPKPKKSPVTQAPAPSPQAATDGQPEVELLDIDMEAVQQRGEDLRLAMAAMNQELFEMY